MRAEMCSKPSADLDDSAEVCAASAPSERLASDVLKRTANGFAPLVSGAALGLCAFDERFDFLVWVALVPLAYCFASSPTGATYWAAFVGGTLCHLLGLDFMRTAYAGEAFFSWVVSAVLLGAFWPVAIMLGRRLWMVGVPASWALPLVWTAIEIARMQVAIILIEVPFPYMQLGTVIVDDTTLIQVADLGGVYAVTWIVAAVNSAFFDISLAIAQRRNSTSLGRAAVAVASLALMLPAAYLYGTWRLSQPAGLAGPWIALVSGRVPVSDAEAVKLHDSVKRQRSTANGVTAEDFPSVSPDLMDTPPIAHKGVDICVWSESAHVAPIVVESDPPAGIRGLELLARKLGAPLAVGCERHAAVPGEAFARMYNCVAYVTPDRGLSGYYDKIFLVPWSEFQPALASTLGFLPAARGDSAFGGPCWRGSRYCGFELETVVRTYRFATTICFEVAFPTLHRQLLAQEGVASPDFFLNCASEAAFSAPLYSRVSLVSQRLRAVECRRSYARVARDGTSAFVDGNGHVLKSAHTTGDSEPLVARLPIDRRWSPYVAVGDWLPACSWLTIVVLAIRQYWHRPA